MSEVVLTESEVVAVVVKADENFNKSFGRALGYAKAAGEGLLKLQAMTGKRGDALFSLVWDAGCKAGRSSLYTYLRVASRWNEIQVVAGDQDLTLGRAAELLRSKPPADDDDNPTEDADPAPKVTADARKVVKAVCKKLDAVKDALPEVVPHLEALRALVDPVTA